MGTLEIREMENQVWAEWALAVKAYGINS